MKFLLRSDRLRVLGNELRSPFFHIRPGIIVNSNGQPLYDRPLITEKPSVLVVTWGRDKNGLPHLGIIRQKRPPSDDPERPGNDHQPVTFAQVVMGYFEKGDDARRAALRERLDEGGQAKVIGVEEISFPFVNLEPNTYSTWHTVVFVEVDLSTVDAQYFDASEMISSVAYLPVTDVLRHIAGGKDETGAYYRGGGTLAALMIFFACHRDMFVIV